jgi:NAD(P)-dependent dehydrogenase (short-subunit alcohol dehydrogenase family)
MNHGDSTQQLMTVTNTRMSFWSNKVVLITGASSGLGWHLARAWHEVGARVVLAARDAERLNQAANSLSPAPERCLAIPCDITRDDSVKNLIEQIQARFGRLDVLVNCAGASARGTIAETSLADFQKNWELNVLALVRCTQHAIPLLTASRGQIVNIGSLAGKLGARYVGPYAATKHAVSGLSQQLRLELEPAGIHVLHVCPGPIRREDKTPRYAAATMEKLPETAHQPGAGAKLNGIDPAWLAKKIVTATEQRKRELVVPWKANILLLIGTISSRLGDWLLKKMTGG